MGDDDGDGARDPVPPSPWTKTFDVLASFPADSESTTEMTSKDIADAVDWTLDRDAAAVSGYVYDLIERGFVERTSPKHREGGLTRYRITDAGIEAREAARPEKEDV